MSRVVVLGPYPPAADPAADAVLAAVRDLRGAGDTVSVVSPVPSAAIAWGDPTHWTGAWRVARAVRGADRVVWFGPAGARPAWPLRRALGAVGNVERRAVPVAGAGERPSWSRRVQRLRAGAPTWIRSVRSRAARARSARRS